MSAPTDGDIARASELRSAIGYHDRLYFEQDQPEIPDADYDALLLELQALEARFPELAIAGSPATSVGGSATFAPVTHPIPMMSLDKAFSMEEFEAWHDRLERRLDHGMADARFVCELKFDGLAISVRYENGELVQAATRGDGKVGEDVTANVVVIGDVPKSLGPEAPSVLEVRGEVYMAISDFEKLNEARRKADEPLYANPRNTAAGSLRQKDASVTASRNLRWFAYQLGEVVGGPEFTHHSETFEYLAKLGFPINDQVKVVDTPAEVKAYFQQSEAARHDFDYETDGAVVKLDSLDRRAEVGNTSHHPRWAIAYKFAPEEKTTKLNAIMVSIGSKGKATPFAVLEPVFVGGSTVSMATLHNEDQVREKNVRPGDTVIVRKAGDVIPEVLGPVLSERPQDLPEWTFPTHCECGHEISRDEGEAAHYCHNPACELRLDGWIEHFTARNAMDIEGFGERTVRIFRKQGLINDVAGIYELDFDNVGELEGFGDISVRNLRAAIEVSKERSLTNLLIALNIRHVGNNSANLIAEGLGHMDAVLAADEETFAAIDGVGPIIARSVHEFFANEHNRNIVERLRVAGVNFQGPVKDLDTPQTLDGLAIVISGGLESYGRDEAKVAVTSRGGKSPGSVSKKTTALVVGASPGASKVNRATELGVPILDEAQFLELLETGELPETPGTLETSEIVTEGQEEPRGAKTL